LSRIASICLNIISSRFTFISCWSCWSCWSSCSCRSLCSLWSYYSTGFTFFTFGSCWSLWSSGPWYCTVCTSWSYITLWSCTTWFSFLTFVAIYSAGTCWSSCASSGFTLFAFAASWACGSLCACFPFFSATGSRFSFLSFTAAGRFLLLAIVGP